MASYWPPFKDLYTYIDHLKVEIGSSAVGGVTDELKEFLDLLHLGFVRSDGTKEVTIDSKMRLAAKELSMYLDMDGHQALYLVHLWVEESVSDGSGRKRQRETVLSEDGHILWIGEETVESSVRDTIEGLIEDMLKAEKDTEQVTVSALAQSLNTRDSPAHKAIIMGKGKDYSLYNWAEIVVQGKEAECTRLVSILMLLYYRPRKQCTADRFVELLGHSLSSPVVLTWAAILIILAQDSHTGTRLASLVQDHEPLYSYKMIMDLPDVQQSTAKQLNGFHCISCHCPAAGCFWIGANSYARK
eukprot:jgi/Picre1/28767/NNA_004166.t1